LPALFAGLVCRPCLPALFEGADDLREEMTLLALVEPGMAASAQFRAFEPVEHEQRAFDPPQLLECEVELVLAALGREFSQHDGRRTCCFCCFCRKLSADINFSTAEILELGPPGPREHSGPRPVHGSLVNRMRIVLL
jgi:hypothetical protein